MLGKRLEVFMLGEQQKAIVGSPLKPTVQYSARSFMFVHAYILSALFNLKILKMGIWLCSYRNCIHTHTYANTLTFYLHKPLTTRRCTQFRTLLYLALTASC